MDQVVNAAAVDQTPKALTNLQSPGLEQPWDDKEEDEETLKALANGSASELFQS
jgi:hypothetical protein